MDDLKMRYNRMFDAVVPSPVLCRTIAAMADTQASGRPLPFVRRLSGVMAAAILLMALLGCGVAAVVFGDSIQGWFGHYFELVTGQSMSQGQTAIIDHLSQEIGVSQTVGKVSVTVDSATVGDDTFFLLLRVEGLRGSSRYSYGFDQINMSVSPDPLESAGGISSHGFQELGMDGDGATLMMLEYNHTSKAGFQEDTRPLDISLSLKDLMRSPHGDRRKMMQEGQWEFSFSLDRSRLPAPVSLPDTKVKSEQLDGTAGHPVLLTHMELTNTGLRFRYDYENGTLNISPYLFAVLDNGVEIQTSGGGGSVMADGKTLNCSYQWMVPVDLEEVAFIRIGDSQLPVP